MAPLGPFEPAPRLAAAVSGGADSLALALLAQQWAVARGGSVLGLVLDHGLRAAAAAEAALTRQRLAGLGVQCVTRHLGLDGGPGLAARARAARYDALADLCRQHGIVHLLLGHHAADQAETVVIRSLAHSRAAGLAGMAALREEKSVRLLRPLLGLPPARLRATLRSAGLGWVEDPSNQDTGALRPRLRALRRDHAGDGAATRALAAAAAVAGRTRQAEERRIAAALARAATLRPEGFAVLRPGPLDPAVLASVIQMVAGARLPPSPDRVAALARDPRPATLAGTRLLPAGRLGPGLMVVREEVAMADEVAAAQDAEWDGRFRLVKRGPSLPPDFRLGALGGEAARVRRHSALPDAVLRTLPALRRGGELVAVPHIAYPDVGRCASLRLTFAPPRPAAGAPFFVP